MVPGTYSVRKGTGSLHIMKGALGSFTVLEAILLLFEVGRITPQRTHRQRRRC